MSPSVPKFLATIATGMLLLGIALGQADVQHFELEGDAVYPECVAYDADRGTFFTGSTTDGTLFQGNVRTGEVSTLLGPDEVAFSSAYGLDIDAQDRLWVVGGPTPRIAVYDTWSGDTLADLGTPEAEQTFLNDVVVAPDGNAYITDSMRPVLFRVPAGRVDVGEPEAWLDLTQTPIEYTSGDNILASVNLNGIDATDDGRYLITVQMNKGLLFRISVEDKSVTEIDTGGEDLTNGDGLALVGTTLYVVRIANNEVVTMALTDDFSSATVTKRTTLDAFIWPACAAPTNDSLLLANTQFNRQGEEAPAPDLPFSILSVPQAAFQPGGDGAEMAPEPEQMETEGAGWFPPEQVSTGQDAYIAHCAACHGSDLGGIPGVAPSLSGGAFMGSWGGQSVAALFNYIRNNMPNGNPNSLPSDTYIDITSFVLAENGFPVGGEERLAAGSSRLNELRITEENQSQGGD